MQLYIGGRLFILTTFSQFDDPAGGKIFHSEAVLGNVQIRSSSAKWSNFGEFKIFFKVFAHLVIRFLGKFSAFELLDAVGYDTKNRPVHG